MVSAAFVASDAAVIALSSDLLIVCAIMLTLSAIAFVSARKGARR